LNSPGYAPCREEFPDLVRLAEDWKGSNAEFVGLNADYPDEIETKTKIGVVHSALPATCIFDQHGTQQAFLQSLHHYEEFKNRS